MFSQEENENRSMIELMVKMLLSTVEEQTKGQSADARERVIDTLLHKFVDESGIGEEIEDLKKMLKRELHEVAEEMKETEEELASEFAEVVEDEVEKHPKGIFSAVKEITDSMNKSADALDEMAETKKDAELKDIQELEDEVNQTLDELEEHIANWPGVDPEDETEEDDTECEASTPPADESFTDGEVLGIAVAGTALGAVLGFGLATLFKD